MGDLTKGIINCAENGAVMWRIRVVIGTEYFLQIEFNNYVTGFVKNFVGLFLYYNRKIIYL